MQIAKTTRPNAEVALSGILAASDIEQFWDRAVAAVTREVALPGFRKGHVPSDRLVAEVGEKHIWREAAEITLKARLEEILKEQGVAPIVPLSVSITADARGSDVPFEIVAVIVPSVTVGDYKAVIGRVTEKTRNTIAEALLQTFSADIPTVLIREEASALLNAMKKDIVAQGMEWSDYLKRVKKTEEGVKADMLPAANKRIALDLIFNEIIKKEGLKLEGEEDKKKEDELAHAIASQGVPHERAHAYARESLLREKVWVVLGVKLETTPQPEIEEEESDS